MTCQIPPEGWDCTRDAGHDGPCAAVPTDPQPIQTASWSYQATHKNGDLVSMKPPARADGYDLYCGENGRFIHIGRFYAKLPWYHRLWEATEKGLIWAAKMAN